MMKKNGFTLVELSIVLVIIGLLIGGILVGQSLIESAKINAQIKQFAQFDIMASNFKSKYRCLPGDNNKINLSGDCDGILEEASPANSFTGENANFWADLSITEWPSSAFSANVVGGRVKIDVNVPKAKIGVETTGVGVGYDANTYQINRYFLGNFESLATSAYNNGYRFKGTLTPIESLTLDKKLDDGLPTNGNLITWPQVGSVLCLNGLSYMVGSQGAYCVSELKILSQANF